VSFRMTLSDLEWLSKIFDDVKHRAASLRQQSYLFLPRKIVGVSNERYNTQGSRVERH